MATKIIDKLVTQLSLETSKGSERAFKNVKASIFNIRRAALVAGSALAGLGVSFSIAKVAKSVDAQAKFAAGIGISFEMLQKLQFAAQKAGATTGELNSFLANLARTMRSTIPGQYNRTLLQMDVRAKTVSQAVVGLAAAFSKLDKPARRQQFGGQLGAPLAIVNFLSQGQEKIAKDIQEAMDIGAVIPGELTSAAAALNSDALLKLKGTVKGLSNTIALKLTPAISEALNQFDRWIVDNKDIIESGVGSSLVAIGNGFVFIAKSIEMVNAALKPFISAFSIAEKLAEKAVDEPFFGKSAKDVAKYFNPFSNIFPKDAKASLLSDNKLINKTIPVPSSVSTSNRTENNANRNVNNTFNINVNGVESPQETARQVVKEFELATAFQAAQGGFNRAKVG